MKKSKIFAALALSACMALGATGLAACAGTAGEPGKSAYEIAVEHGFEGTEQEWLESLIGPQGPQGAQGDKGDKGDDAVAPEIEIGENGNWFIDGVDTGIKAQGDKGEDGANGANGERGNKIFRGTGDPAAELEAIEGDMYVDTESWNVWFFEGGEWKNEGSINGEHGDTQTQGTQISVEADSTYDMPISDISTGVHIIEVDLGSTTLDTGRLQAKIGGGTLSEIVYSETRSTDGHNVYYGYIDITDGATAITFSTIGEAVNGSVIIKDWEMPILKADGNPIEIPMNSYNEAETVDESAIKARLDSSVTAGSYIFSISGIKAVATRLWIGSTRKSVTASKFSNYSLSIADSDLNLDDDTYVYIAYTASTDEYRIITPVTVTLTQAS